MDIETEYMLTNLNLRYQKEIAGLRNQIMQMKQQLEVLNKEKKPVKNNARKS
tara:strand:- start:7822 stop:7977 length:156 start_codon:yes stop_codon:yes gene_type:complete